MPITYEIDTAAGVFFARWFGKITKEELASHWPRFMKDAHAHGIYRSLADLREAVEGPSETDLWLAVDEHYRENLGNNPWRTALLVANQAQLEMARNWKVLTFDTVATGLFSDREKALKWLKRNQAGAAAG